MAIKHSPTLIVRYRSKSSDDGKSARVFVSVLEGRQEG